MSNPKFLKGTPQAIPERGISEDVAKRYHYWVAEVPEDYPASPGTVLHKLRGQEVQVANLFDEDGKKIIGQKVRGPNKEFAVIGDVSENLFGRHTAKSGKLLVVTEGEIDALSYSEARKSWPAVSLPNGTGSARKAIEANIEYLEQFDKVVFFFDNDEAGRKALDKVKGLLSPGKASIHALPATYKDLNEAWMAGDVKAIMEGVYQAKTIRPDGIVAIEDLVEEAMEDPGMGLPWFDDELTQATYGRRWCEIIMIGAGTGIGKTDLLTQQIEYDVNTLGHKVGVLMLEAKPKDTTQRIAGKSKGKIYHLPGSDRSDLREAIEALAGKVQFYDSFGETEWDRIKKVVRHMALSSGIRIFYIDHLTAMASHTDERGSLEQITKEMSGLANELEILIHCVSHLATPDGTPHEEGGRVMIRHFKGARAIGFWSHTMVGLERDQQADDPREQLKTTVRILKHRYYGPATGKTFDFGYNTETGILVPWAAMGFDEDPQEEIAF